MKVDIAGALRELKRLIEQMKELIEWEKLALSERKPNVPSFLQLPDHFREDMEQTYAWFWNLDYSLHEVLDREDLSVSDQQREKYRRRLEDLEEQANHVAHSARFIKP